MEICFSENGALLICFEGAHRWWTSGPVGQSAIDPKVLTILIFYDSLLRVTERHFERYIIIAIRKICWKWKCYSDWKQHLWARFNIKQLAVKIYQPLVIPFLTCYLNDQIRSLINFDTSCFAVSTHCGYFIINYLELDITSIYVYYSAKGSSKYNVYKIRAVFN